MEDPTKFLIKKFNISNNFTIEIQFEEGKTQVIDFSKINRKGWWEKLKDPNYFKNVTINGIRNLEWPDGHEFMPEHLYYWEKYSSYYTIG